MISPSHVVCVKENYKTVHYPCTKIAKASLLFTLKHRKIGGVGSFPLAAFFSSCLC